MTEKIEIHETYSLKRYIEAYTDAIRWISTYLPGGVVNGRFREYVKIIERFIDAGRNSVNSIEFHHAVFEITTLIQIFQELKDNDGKALFESVKHLVKGHKYRYDGVRINRESGIADSCRNFSFELLTASRFSRLGYDVSLNHVCDVVFSVENCNCFIECKRVISEKQIGKNIGDARKQLENRIGLNKSTSVGIVFLDITDVVNPDGVSFVNGSRQEVFELYYSLIKHFIRNNIQAIQKCSKKSVSVVCFVVNWMSYSRYDEQFLNGQVVISMIAHWNNPCRVNVAQTIIDSMKVNSVCQKPTNFRFID